MTAMRMLAAIVAITASSMPAQSTRSPRAASATVVLQNARVRAYRTTLGALAGVSRGPGVVVWLEDSASGTAGRALWLDDVAVAPAGGAGRDRIVIVQPLERAAAVATPAQSGSQPGEAPFTGLSFVPIFDNDRVNVIRARMDVGAREAFHTHGSDTIVIHLSGGEIEDTANGKTVVNRWKPGDVEFEARGSSHSARNVSHPVDVVLVVLEP
jgi:quercetin dioxygenase-like cupin family protein